eukprot:6206228-Pyramimonas_sp.AAC.1
MSLFVYHLGRLQPEGHIQVDPHQSSTLQMVPQDALRLLRSRLGPSSRRSAGVTAVVAMLEIHMLQAAPLLGLRDLLELGGASPTMRPAAGGGGSVVNRAPPQQPSDQER